MAEFKTAIVYHRVDWDGYTSAAIAKRVFPDADLIGWNYRDPLPMVDSYDRVVLVDLTVYSVNPDMSRDFSWMMENQYKMIWIDHHPIISEVPGEYAGIQKEGIGACWLTWHYFHENYGIGFSNMDHIKLAATYDVFRKDGLLCSWEDAWAYQLYLNYFGPAKTEEEALHHVYLAEDLLDATYVEQEMHLQNGYIMEEERSCREKSVFAKHAWEVEIDGHRGWMVETLEQPSLIIKDHSDSGDGDFFLIFSEEKRADNGNYIVSIRVPESSNFNAQAFAKAHGGGGHPKACGCQICEDELQAIFHTYSYK